MTTDKARSSRYIAHLIQTKKALRLWTFDFQFAKPSQQVLLKIEENTFHERSQER